MAAIGEAVRTGGGNVGAALIAAWLCPAYAAQPPCAPPSDAELVGIAYVIDGDTVVLDDSRHLRLVGLNTPELGGRLRARDEPFARAARDALVAMLSTGESALLVYGRERADRHGRELAHLFRPDGTNVQAALLEGGLAFAIAVSPNLAYVDCYAAAENRAFDNGRGVWSHYYFRPRAAEQLTTGDLGFRRVRGRVGNITRTNNAVWIGLGTRVSVRIDRDDLKHFPPVFPDRLSGQDIVVRGWLTGRGRFRIHVHHPVGLERHLAQGPSPQ